MYKQIGNAHAKNKAGAVVIGRNEGERLKECLNSLINKLDYIVYVDSGSTDQSVEFAESLGVTVVSLDMTKPFTAARARNSGLNVLLENQYSLKYVQFVDGDCVIQPNWLSQAFEFLEKYNDYAAVCGRRRERNPEASIYNLLCDIEWDTPVGDAKTCGGDALFRVTALKSVGGYRECLIAGEEPEMCFRMRKLGWKIMRLDSEMTLHDAAMDRIGQWWKRNQRAGHAYAEIYTLHQGSKERFRKKEILSISLWGGYLPLGILATMLVQEYTVFLFLIYPAQILRLTHHYYPRFYSLKKSFIYAVSNVISKFPQLFGVVIFKINYFIGKKSRIIEYK